MQLADYNLLYNTLSFAIATFGASTVFFFCQRSQVAPAYKTSLTLAGSSLFDRALSLFKNF